MIWGFLTVIVVGLVLLFAAPFLDFLTPDSTIWLIDTSNSMKPVLLAKGSETLWFQWQSWSYIFIFCLVTALILGLMFNTLRTFSDKSLVEAKQKLAQKSEELEQFKRQYRQQVEQDVLRAHSQKAERLNKRERELDTIQVQAARQQTESSERLKLANHAVRRQHKETMSKLGQRDRLREEKKLIAEFLEQANWTFTDGTKITYSSLKEVAKRHQPE
ncbi:hypothetical protein [Aeromonas veronii]|uniref:hypothetical protein n=1 Tax=Aeromonas veronii TaxID=654 RepID=UPI003B9F490D